MMLPNTLDRYLLRDVAAAAVAVTAVLLAIMLSARFARFLGAVATGELPRELLAQVVALSSLQYLVLLVPAGVLLAVMLTLGRLYKDNEIAAMMGCGVGLMRLYRPCIALALIAGLLTAWLSLDAGPWAGRQADYIFKSSRNQVRYSPFEPGRFKSIGDGQAVFYTAQMDARGEQLTTVFSRIREADGDSIVIASEGRQTLDEVTGERRVLLYGGWRIQGEIGRADYDLMRFDEFETRITPPEFVYMGGKRKLAQTQTLVGSPDIEDQAELAWRISAPLSVFILGLLAVPLSYIKPRQGRYAKLVFGIGLYLVYSNLLSLGQAWMIKGIVPPAVGLWWVHALFAGMALLLIGKRLNWFAR